MRNECFALRLCSVLKDLLGLEKVFILNYGNPIHSAQVCLLNSILRRSLIRNVQDRPWVQREGEGWRKDPGDIQAGSAAPPQAHWSVSPPALPTLFPTYIYIVVSRVMGQSIPFSFSIIPETSSCYSWHFSNWKHSEMWLLAQEKKKIWILIVELLGQQCPWHLKAWTLSGAALWRLTDLAELELFRIHCRVISHFCSPVIQQQKVHLEYKCFFH